MSDARTVLVTGGTGGIGEAVMRRLAAAGFRVYATYRANEGKARELAADLPNCRMLRCDLTSDASIDAELAQVFQDPGIQIFVHCVTADLKLKPVEALEAEEVREDIDVNLLSAFRVLKRILSGMKKNRSGTILFLLSSVIEQTPARMSSYTAAKYGLLGLLKSLKREVGDGGIRVAGLSPSFVETDLLKPFPPKMLEMERAKSEGGSFLSPADIADLVLKAVVDEKRFEHGVNVYVRDKKELKDLLSGE